MMTWLLAGVLSAVLIVRFYVRHAPHAAGEYHSRDSAYHQAGNYKEDGGFEAVRLLSEPGREALDRIMRVIDETTRTQLLDGGLEEGHVSYITRSPFWGFPDTTNIWIEGDRLHMRGHLRFGRSDLGVNQRRVSHWLALAGL